MSNENHTSLERELLQELLLEKSQALLDTVKAGDLPASVELINSLYQARHDVFYREVGALTRGLHEAIKSFGADVGSQLALDEQASEVLNDASDRLNHVIELTETNSHATMDRIDRSLSLVDVLDDQSERFKGLLSLVGQLEDEFEALNGVYDRTCELRDASEKTVAELRELLTDIVVSQSVQDITGQLIRRVITLLTQVEGQLVKLIRMAATVEQLNGIETTLELSKESNPEKRSAENSSEKSKVKAEGPQINKSSPDVAQNQDDVDDLLSSLGF